MLCYGPDSLPASAGVFTHPQLQKGLVYFALLGVALQRGMRPRYLVVVGAYILMAVLSVLNGRLLAGLTVSQMLSSFVTLTVGWTALAINWDYRRDLSYLKVLSFLPIACICLGIVMQVGHLHPLFEDSGDANRLAGATGAANLALTSFVACVTASITFRLTRWRWAPVLLVADAVILGLTVSRGATIALVIALLWPALRYAFGPDEARWLSRRSLRIAMLGVAVATAAALVVPHLLARGKANITYIPGVGFRHDATTGRTEAWHEFLVIARRSPLFGHGLGSGPITKIAQQGFLAQHNEYLRLFLEGGYIGGGIILVAIVGVISACIANAPRRVRIDLIGLAVGFAALSYTDNTLTSVNIQVPFCLVFGIVGSAGLRRSATSVMPRERPWQATEAPEERQPSEPSLSPAG